MVYVLNQILSEQKILLFQELFWKEGINSIEVDSSESACFLLKTFLSALPHYAHVGCISFGDTPALTVSVDNIAKEYEAELAGKEYAFFIEQLLLNEFHYDFFWIEYRADKETPAWLNYFIEKIDEYWLAKEKTILIFSIKEK